jgi:flagellar hook-associated protein 1 FlgK
MSTALSAMTVAQRLAEVASHNIANANTPGYSRQVALLRPALPIRTTAGLMGTGVTIERIMAIRDEFLNVRLNMQKTGLGKADVQSKMLTEVEIIIQPGPDTGVGFALDEFFRSVNELAANAQGTVSRESVVQSAITLAGTFKSTNEQLRQIQAHVRAEFADTIDRINSDVAQIAQLNGRVMALTSGNETPNDLVDQRDRMIEELSELIPVQVINENNVSNVLFEGRLMVNGTEHMTMSADASTGKLKLRISDTIDVFDAPSGAIGGLAALFNESLPRYIGYIDELARSLIGEFNAIHSTGVGLQNGYTSLTSSAELADLNLNNIIGDEPLGNQALTFAPTAGTLYITTTNIGTGEMARTAIDYDPSADSVVDISDKISGVPYMNASVSAGYLTITSWPGYRFDFSNKLLPDGGAVGTSAITVSGAYTGATDRSFTFYPMNSGTVGVTEGLSVAVIDDQGSFLGLLDVGANYGAGAALHVNDGVKVSFGAGTLQASQLLSADASSFTLSDGDLLTVSVNGQPDATITFRAVDFADINSPTAEEVVLAVNNADVGVKATAINGAVMIYPVVSGPTNSIRAGGTAAVALGIVSDTVTLLADGYLGTSEVTTSGTYTGAADESYTLYPMDTGTIGQVGSLNVAVVDSTGAFRGLLDIGSGYTAGTALAMADGLQASFSVGSVPTVQPQSIAEPVGGFVFDDGDALTISVDGAAPGTVTLDSTDTTAAAVAAKINAAGVGVTATVVTVPAGDVVLVHPSTPNPTGSLAFGGAGAAVLGLPAGPVTADSQTIQVVKVTDTGTISTDSQTIDVLGETDTGGLLNALGINSFFEGDNAGSISVSSHVLSNSDNIAAAKSSPPGDNANAVRFARIKHERIVDQDSQTLNEYFASMIGRAGIDASQALRSQETQIKLVDGLERQRDSMSGVSLEEEMARLMQNQQAYYAAVKLIKTVDDMLESLTRL